MSPLEIRPFPLPTSTPSPSEERAEVIGYVDEAVVMTMIADRERSTVRPKPSRSVVWEMQPRMRRQSQVAIAR